MCKERPSAWHLYMLRPATTGVLTVVAGNGTAGFSGDNGPATSAQLYSPQSVAVDSAGNLHIGGNISQNGVTVSVQ
jgi:hypothetical protein